MVWLRPAPVRPPISDCIRQMEELRHGLLLEEAAALAGTVLQSDAGYEAHELAPVYAALADVRFLIQQRRSARENRDLVRVVALYAQAEALGHPLGGEALVQLGQVYEWMGQPRNALEQYDRALQRQPADPLAVRQRILALQCQAIPTPSAELHDQLDVLLSAAVQRPEILQWTVEQKVQLLLEEERIADAERVVVANSEYLQVPPYQGCIGYLRALLQYKAGDHDAAELILRDLRSRLPVRDEVYAKSGWLLGTVIMSNDGPQRPLEAVSFFQDVLASHNSGDAAAACRLGMAEALTDLQRFDEALEYYRAALRDLKQIGRTPLINREVVRNSLTVRSRLLNEDREYTTALAYLQLASELVPLDDAETRVLYLYDLAMLNRFLGERRQEELRIAEASADAVQAAQLANRSRQHFRAAAEAYLELSERRMAEESQAAEALWQAAAMFDAAGERQRTIHLLQNFLAARPNSHHVPMVLYRLGQAYQAEGQLHEAVAQYQRCIKEHRRTTPAQQSYIPLADCFMMLGPDYVTHAQETLLAVVEEPPGEPAMFTPKSMVYRDALFKLGELASRRGQHEEAIERFDEALQRYPDDPRRIRATFQLADAYRHSGLELESQPDAAESVFRHEALRQEKRRRLRQAELLFGAVIEGLSETTSQPPRTRQDLQRKLSYGYRADCAFELGDTGRALDLYHDIIRVYPDDPVALHAYVQIINCYEILGRVEDVKPALQRAQWLTDKIDPERFRPLLVRNDPQDWHRLFRWIASTGDYDG